MSEMLAVNAHGSRSTLYTRKILLNVVILVKKSFPGVRECFNGNVYESSVISKLPFFRGQGHLYEATSVWTVTRRKKWNYQVEGVECERISGGTNLVWRFSLVSAGPLRINRGGGDSPLCLRATYKGGLILCYKWKKVITWQNYRRLLFVAWEDIFYLDIPTIKYLGSRLIRLITIE